MRMLLEMPIEVEAGNRAINGERTGLIFFDLQEPSQIPAIAKPFFVTEAAKDF